MSPSKDEPTSGSSTSKIAIKGFSLSSKPATSNPSKSRQPPSTLGKRPRTHFGHDDSDSENEANGRGVTHEIVTGFGEGGAIKKDEKKVEAPLVITPLKNRAWGGPAREKKNLLPPEVQAEIEAKRKEREGRGQNNGKQEGVDVVNSQDGQIQWGLSVRKRATTDGNANAQEATVDEDIKRDGSTSDLEAQPSHKEKTADEEALAALLGEEKERKGPDLVIAPLNPSIAERISEEDAYRRAIASAPDASTLEDYERIPVEEFGAAMLRGMGWKGETNSSSGDKKREVKRRQNLLGLGAKELKDAEELGAWVQKSDVKRLQSGGEKRPDRRPKVAEYKRERDERRYREGGYRESERDRDRNGYRDRDRYDDRDRRDRRR